MPVKTRIIFVSRCLIYIIISCYVVKYHVYTTKLVSVIILCFVSLKCKLLYIYTDFNILWFKNLYDKFYCFIAVKKDLFCKKIYILVLQIIISYHSFSFTTYFFKLLCTDIYLSKLLNNI